MYGEAADHEGESTLLHVLPSMSVQWRDAMAELTAAEDEVWRAFDYKGNTNWERAMNARQNIVMVERLVRLQSDINDVYEYIETEYDVYDDTSDRYYEVHGSSADVDELVDDHEAIEEHTADWDPLIPAIETKLDQLDWQIELLEDTYAAVDLMWGTSHASVRYNLATDDFGRIETELETGSSTVPNGVTDDAFVDLVSDWREEAVDELRGLLTA